VLQLARRRRPGRGGGDQTPGFRDGQRDHANRRVSSTG
jgi:hypothetical protein